VNTSYLNNKNNENPESMMTQAKGNNPSVPIFQLGGIFLSTKMLQKFHILFDMNSFWLTTSNIHVEKWFFLFSHLPELHFFFYSLTLKCPLLPIYFFINSS